MKKYDIIFFLWAATSRSLLEPIEPKEIWSKRWMKLLSRSLSRSAHFSSLVTQNEPQKFDTGGH